MKRKIVLYMGMDDDGTGGWSVDERKMALNSYTMGDYFDIEGTREPLRIQKALALKMFGAPPCKPGKQVRVTLRVEKIEKVED